MDDKKAEQLLVVQTQSVEGDTWLSFSEPAETHAATVCKHLAEGRYDKPFLLETRRTRSLCFGIDGAIQSEMLLDAPDTLVCAYTRKMMGFLLFRKRPRNVLMLGLGGGSLVKYCHRHLPTTRLTVVEIDPRVIALRSHFQIPPDDARLVVVSADGSTYVRSMISARKHTDVLLVDAFDRSGIAAAVTERVFLQDAKRALSAGGIFVMNLFAGFDDCMRYIEDIRSVFGEPVITTAIAETGNVIVFAGDALRRRRRVAGIRRMAQQIEARFGLHFPTLLRRTCELQNQFSLAAPTT
jgi:spermidine synthase